MAITLPLDKMSIEEKIQAMESIWDDLCKSPESISSPSWHGEALKKRAQGIKEKKLAFVDWETAKRNIKNDIS